MGKHELKNKKDEGKWNWALLAANVLLTLCFAAVFWPILHKGSLSFLDKTSNLLALAAFLPLVLRPWKKASAPLALLHDLLLLGSASAVSVVTVEYMVKGGSVGLEQSFWQGWLCYIGLYAAAYLITARGRLAVCVGMGISLLHGLIDHYVMLFRGTPVMLSDVFSIGTAANVAQGYSAPVELSVLRSVSTAVLYCVLVCLMQRRWKLFERWYVRRGCSLIVVALAAYAVHYGLGITGTGINFWASSRSYSEFYYFLRCAGRSIVRAPEGYSADGLQTLAEDYKGEPGTKTPNIIVIMNESFSDLGIVGDFETNEDYMPFVHSMQKGQKNTITGNLLVSTFGGGTANTEFEFLAGDTMAFLPFGCSPYQMYVKSKMPSLVGALEAQNYQTVAMHPYLSTSWNRPQVYSSFGFDEQCYEDSFPSDVERVRGRVSDSASYKKIIELYENKPEGQPFFLFDVTMQNHGGYEREGYPAFEEKIHLTGGVRGQVSAGRYLPFSRALLGRGGAGACQLFCKRFRGYCDHFLRRPSAECSVGILRRAVRQYGCGAFARAEADQADHAVLHLGELRHWVADRRGNQRKLPVCVRVRCARVLDLGLRRAAPRDPRERAAH